RRGRHLEPVPFVGPREPRQELPGIRRGATRAAATAARAARFAGGLAEEVARDLELLEPGVALHAAHEPLERLLVLTERVGEPLAVRQNERLLAPGEVERGHHFGVLFGDGAEDGELGKHEYECRRKHRESPPAAGARGARRSARRENGRVSAGAVWARSSLRVTSHGVRASAFPVASFRGSGALAVRERRTATPCSKTRCPPNQPARPNVAAPTISSTSTPVET